MFAIMFEFIFANKMWNHLCVKIVVEIVLEIILRSRFDIRFGTTFELLFEICLELFVGIRFCKRRPGSEEPLGRTSRTHSFMEKVRNSTGKPGWGMTIFELTAFACKCLFWPFRLRSFLWVSNCGHLSVETFHGSYCSWTFVVERSFR